MKRPKLLIVPVFKMEFKTILDHVSWDLRKPLDSAKYWVSDHTIVKTIVQEFPQQPGSKTTNSLPISHLVVTKILNTPVRTPFTLRLYTAHERMPFVPNERTTITELKLNDVQTCFDVLREVEKFYQKHCHHKPDTLYDILSGYVHYNGVYINDRGCRVDLTDDGY